jgi:uncharacterized repeat protein (TIGR01451 family)
LAVADFNGDGEADLAVTDSSSSRFHILLGNGDGTFQAALATATGAGPDALVVADFNGDGRADVAIANTLDGTVGIYLGNGDGTFRSPNNYVAGTSFNTSMSIAFGDFNGDGNQDLAVGSGGNGSYGNSVSVFLGKGNGTFSTSINLPTTTSFEGGADGAPTAVAVADLNGDGIADVIAGNVYGAINVFVGRGDGTFLASLNYQAWGMIYGAPDNVNAFALADFNGDGRVDLAALDSLNSDVAVLLSPSPSLVLSVNISHSGNFAAGQTGGSYTIVVSNNGWAPVMGGVSVTDPLPAGATVLNVSGSGWNCTMALVCSRTDSLAAFASYPPITVIVSIASNAPPYISNSVSVSGIGQTGGVAYSSDYVVTFNAAQSSQVWTPVSNRPSEFRNENVDAMYLLTDGTVMVQGLCSPNWYRLAPDSLGNYANGSWTQMQPLPAGYGPAAFASAVLSDGRLLIEGGEQNITAPGSNSCNYVWTNLGAIFDPTTNSWTSLSPPLESQTLAILRAPSCRMAACFWLMSSHILTALTS